MNHKTICLRYEDDRGFSSGFGAMGFLTSATSSVSWKKIRALGVFMSMYSGVEGEISRAEAVPLVPKESTSLVAKLSDTEVRESMLALRPFI